MTTPHVAVIASCPECSAPLRERHNRTDGSAFLGCTSFPRCRWTAPHDAVADELARQVVELRRALASKRDDAAPVEQRDLRALLAFVHPDRHPGGRVDAHEVAVRISGLLDRAKRAA